MNRCHDKRKREDNSVTDVDSRPTSKVAGQTRKDCKLLLHESREQEELGPVYGPVSLFLDLKVTLSL